MDRFLISIEFLPHPKSKKLYELKCVELKTKPTTWKRAQELALIEEKKCGWEFTNISITRVAK